MRPKSSKSFTPEDLEGYRSSQRLAYDCVQAVEKELKPGWTEIRAAQELTTYLKDHGVGGMFHTPFAWFGDRTRFADMPGYKNFLPSKQVLGELDLFLLDVAPILNGYMSDIGYSSSLTPNPGLQRARQTLKEIRAWIPKLFESEKNTNEIWNEVDQEIKRRQFDNCHKLYPFATLGHRVYRFEPDFQASQKSIPVSMASWFNFSTYWAIGTNGALGELITPHRKGSKKGLWAIEPHIGWKEESEGLGAKFEEILIVDDQSARWLDDSVPHAQ